MGTPSPLSACEPLKQLPILPSINTTRLKKLGWRWNAKWRTRPPRAMPMQVKLYKPFRAWDIRLQLRANPSLIAIAAHIERGRFRQNKQTEPPREFGFVRGTLMFPAMRYRRH